MIRGSIGIEYTYLKLHIKDCPLMVTYPKVPEQIHPHVPHPWCVAVVNERASILTSTHTSERTMVVKSLNLWQRLGNPPAVQDNSYHIVHYSKALVTHTHLVGKLEWRRPPSHQPVYVSSKAVKTTTQQPNSVSGDIQRLNFKNCLRIRPTRGRVTFTEEAATYIILIFAKNPYSYQANPTALEGRRAYTYISLSRKE